MRSFMKTVLLMVVASFCLIGLSNPIDENLQQRRIAIEKKALVVWVSENSHNKVSEAKANRIVDYAYEYAAEHALDPLVILSILKNESGFREKVRSKEGATGMMQVIPRWHKAKINGRDPSNMRVSIDVGAQILREYLDLSNNDLGKALNRYSGGGGKGYYNKVAGTHKKLSKHIVEYAFANEQHIYAMHRIDKPIINPSVITYQLAKNDYKQTGE